MQFHDRDGHLHQPVPVRVGRPKARASTARVSEVKNKGAKTVERNESNKSMQHKTSKATERLGRQIDSAVREILGQAGLQLAPGCRTKVEHLFRRPGVAVTANYAAVEFA
jgi:hypothetical protein